MIQQIFVKLSQRLFTYICYLLLLNNLFLITGQLWAQSIDPRCPAVIRSKSEVVAGSCSCTDTHFVYPNRCRSDCWYGSYIFNGKCLHYTSYACTRDACHCFHPDTKILMADKSQKLARDVKGDESIWNPALQRAVKIKGIWVGPEKPVMYQFTAGEYQLTVTDKHPMLVLAKEAPSKFDVVTSALPNIDLYSAASKSSSKINSFVVRQARHLKVGDQMFNSEGKIVSISAIKETKLPDTEKVYHFDLEGDAKDPLQHLLVADGLISGDGILEDEGYEVVAEPK